MISYEYYKAMHLFFILSFFSSVGYVVCASEFMQKKSGKFLVGLISFLILVAGMGLVARLGYRYGQPFGLWIKLKIVLWIFINVLFVGLFKIKTKQYKTGVTILLFVASCWGTLAAHLPVIILHTRCLTPD